VKSQRAMKRWAFFGALLFSSIAMRALFFVLVERRRAAMRKRAENLGAFLGNHPYDHLVQNVSDRLTLSAELETKGDFTGSEYVSTRLSSGFVQAATGLFGLAKTG